MAGEPDSASAQLGLQARHTGAGSSPPPREATRADLCGARSEVERAHVSRPPALRGEMAGPGGTHRDTKILVDIRMLHCLVALVRGCTGRWTRCPHLAARQRAGGFAAPIGDRLSPQEGSP